MWIRLIRLSVPEGVGQRQMWQVWAEEKWARLPGRPPDAPLSGRQVWQDPEFPEELVIFEHWESRQAYQTWLKSAAGHDAEQTWKQFFRETGIVRQTETFEVLKEYDT